MRGVIRGVRYVGCGTVVIRVVIRGGLHHFVTFLGKLDVKEVIILI